jgi:hypothetical protein
MIEKIKNINISKSTMIFIAGAFFVLFFLKQCNQISNLKQDLNNTQKIADRNFNNLLASQDSVRTYISKNDRLVYEIKSFEYDINSAELKNRELHKKYLNVLKENKSLKNINSLITTDLSIKDSIIDSSIKITQSNSEITFNFNDKKKWDQYNWRYFSGELKIKKIDTIYSILNSRFDFNQAISLQTAIVDENGIKSLRITTPYSGVIFTNIENINLVNDKLNPITKKPKNWGLGINVGYGINLNNNQVISTGPSIGVGVFYSPNWLRF